MSDAPTTPNGSADDSLDGEVAARIRSAREDRDLTQGAVSTRTRLVDPAGKGISRTALVGYEAGNTRPGLREIRLLCEVLQVTPSWLVYGSDTPFQSTLPSLALVKSTSLRDALRAGIAIAALKGHERDALLSLALSLAGRQLGDVRLSGLLTWVALIAEDFGELLRKFAPEGAEPESLEDLMEMISRGSGSSYGTKLKLDEEGEVTHGEWVYPDPKVGKTDK